jgi:hypothetical protein
MTAAHIHVFVEADHTIVAGSRLQHATAMHSREWVMSRVTSRSRVKLHWGRSTPTPNILRRAQIFLTAKPESVQWCAD